jgi:hypothetical protein
MSLDGIRRRVNSGQVRADTPTRRAGTHERYQPAREFTELRREFFRDYAVQAGPKADEESSARQQMKALLTDYEKFGRGRRRRKAVTLRGALITVAITAAIVVALWLMWPMMK